jgi:hypothetical protein
LDGTAAGSSCRTPAIRLESEGRHHDNADDVVSPLPGDQGEENYYQGPQRQPAQEEDYYEDDDDDSEAERSNRPSPDVDQRRHHSYGKEAKLDRHAYRKELAHRNASGDRDGDPTAYKQADAAKFHDIANDDESADEYEYRGGEIHPALVRGKDRYDRALIATSEQEHAYQESHDYHGDDDNESQGYHGDDSHGYHGDGSHGNRDNESRGYDGVDSHGYHGDDADNGAYTEKGGLHRRTPYDYYGDEVPGGDSDASGSANSNSDSSNQDELDDDAAQRRTRMDSAEEERDLPDPGQFRYNQKVFITALPCFLLVLMMAGEL